jgi:hypothetical protein
MTLVLRSRSFDLAVSHVAPDTPGWREAIAGQRGNSRAGATAGHSEYRQLYDTADGSPQPLTRTYPYHANRLSRCALRSDDTGAIMDPENWSTG